MWLYMFVVNMQQLQLMHRVSEKNSQNCFCHNFVKFLLTLIIFGTLMVKTTKLCEIYIFST